MHKKQHNLWLNKKSPSKTTLLALTSSIFSTGKVEVTHYIALYNNTKTLSSQEMDISKFTCSLLAESNANVAVPTKRSPTYILLFIIDQLWLIKVKFLTHETVNLLLPFPV